MTTRERESALSVRLAAELYQRGFTARAEVVCPDSRHIYVKVLIGSTVIALEVKHGQSPAKRAHAVKQAKALLEQELAKFAVVVCYPDDTAEESLPESQLTWTVCYGNKSAAPDGVAEAGKTDKTGRNDWNDWNDWSEGDLTLPAQAIREASAQLAYPSHPEKSQADNPDNSAGSSLLKFFEEINQTYNELLEEEKLPTDLAANYKHYLYGFPKEEI